MTRYLLCLVPGERPEVHFDWLFINFGAREVKGFHGPSMRLHRVLSVGTGSPLQTSPNCLLCRMVLVAPRWETEVHFDEVHWILDLEIGYCIIPD